ncbi:hypothetical protein CBL_13858 [Carabus blaptoides fortunei]
MRPCVARTPFLPVVIVVVRAEPPILHPQRSSKRTYRACRGGGCGGLFVLSYLRRRDKCLSDDAGSLCLGWLSAEERPGQFTGNCKPGLLLIACNSHLIIFM